jgi:hypothetical protein
LLSEMHKTGTEESADERPIRGYGGLSFWEHLNMPGILGDQLPKW